MSSTYYQHRLLVGFAAVVSLTAALPRLALINGLEQLSEQPLLEGSLWWLSFFGGMLTTFLVMLFFLYFNAYWFRYFEPKGWSIPRIWALKIAMNMLAVLLLTPLLAQFQLFFLKEIVPSRFFNLLNFIRFSFFAGLSMLLLYLLELLSRTRKAEQENWRLREEQMQSQLAHLKAQMNPHFLFNSLNSLSGTIRNESKEEALIFVEKLSQVFRSTLQGSDRHLISLKEELELVEAYLFMLQKRFGDKLLVRIKVMPGNLDTQVPPMAIQLLIENALKHNTISRKMPLTIEITGEKDYIHISNNYQPRTQKEAGFGLGLSNLRKRYELLAKKEVFIGQKDGFFEVRLPIIDGGCK
ncbi:MAG: histidine kinase [Saprospiraceae bacterium]